ncbi:MAG TPA: AMP-binding protein [Allosphingosinicella sp.]|jgi:crotonobetaine/carnitine-CoA ligase
MGAYDYQGPWTMASIIDDRAEKLADHPAILTLERAISYGELRTRAQQVAAQLASLGVQPGDRVATMQDATPDYVFTWLGCAWAGAVEVPVNTEYKGQFLEHVLEESGASVLIVQARYVSVVARVTIPQLRHLIVVGTPQHELPAGKVGHLLADASTFAMLPMVPRSESDLLYILYTSGTTGLSKGVMHCNRSAMWAARVWRELAALTVDDVGYSYLPIYHVTARSALIKACMIAGASCVLRERFSVTDFWADVDRHQATFTMYMGSVVLFLTQQPERPGEGNNSLRVAGGAACPPRVAAEFTRRFGTQLVEVYGMTEVGTVSGPRRGMGAPGTMGRPFEHVEIRIHDSDDNPLPPNTRGEIVIRPAEPYAIMQGYWQRPEATVEAWRNLWFHTGDIGMLNEAGDLTFVDRLKDAMRRRGENISSFEVERAVQAHPSVRECAAFAIESEATEDEVMIAVVRHDGAEPTAEELHHFCQETMPRFAVPRFIRFVESLPKTPTGRVQKHILRDTGITPDTFERTAPRRPSKRPTGV